MAHGDVGGRGDWPRSLWRDNGGEVRTVTETATVADQNDPVTGDAILIETRISDAVHHTGEVLRGSFIGESAFCPGGKTSGGGGDVEGFASVITTFRCPNGRLTIRYSPLQPSAVQSAVWDVVSGTGSYKGLRGGGSMVARFGKAKIETKAGRPSPGRSANRRTP